MKHKFIKKLFSITMIATLACLSIFSPHLHPANADNAPTHNLIIKNQAVDGKSGEFTYRVKANGYYYYDIIIIVGDPGDGSIALGYLYNTVDDYENDRHSVIAENTSNLMVDFTFYDSGDVDAGDGTFTLNGGDITYKNDFISGLENNNNFYAYTGPCVVGSWIENCSAYVKDDNLKELFTVSNTTPIAESGNPWGGYLYETGSYISFNGGGTYDVYVQPGYGAQAVGKSFSMSSTTLHVPVLIEKEIYELYQRWDFEKWLTYIEYVDFSSNLGQPDQEGYYTFTLSTGDTKTLQIPEGYYYEIQQLTQDGWSLVSINDDETATSVSGAMGSEDITYTFLNKKLVDDEENDPISPANPTNPTDPTITVPNTGQTTANSSAVRTGIVAFAVLATIIRVIYLIRRYQKS